jgi:hypothetical protein
MNNRTKARSKRAKNKGATESTSTAKNIRMVVTAEGTRHLPLDKTRRPYKRIFPESTRK